MSHTLPHKRIPAENSPNGVYERIKSRLIRYEFPVGRRIVIEKLADQLFVSATPVREALARLTAERFVQDIPNAGFFAKPLSQTELSDLYDLLELLLGWSASRAAERTAGPGPLKPPDFKREFEDAVRDRPDAVAGLASDLFHHLARQSGNEDLIRLVSNLNDRTLHARWKTYEAFGDPNKALLRVFEAYSSLDFPAVGTALSAYFLELREWLPGLFRSLARSRVRTAR
ncbi:GntR family transcriptional regulator [Hyphococcus luteus]|nr:GntR family transcriptional regulator [Marinicaulis flavus]